MADGEKVIEYTEIKEDIDKLLKKILRDVQEDDLKVKLMGGLVNVRELVSSGRKTSNN